MTRGRLIGFDRRLELDWLDTAASRVAAGDAPPAVRRYLWELLDGVVAGTARNSARGKTVTVLAHVWSDVSPEVAPLRDRAARVLPDLDPSQRLALHWAMATATYPFFAAVADSVGRSLRLKSRVTLSQVLRRVQTTWGDRSTVERAAQRVIRSMVAWGALAESSNRGAFVSVSPRLEASSPVGQMLLEGRLLSSDRRSRVVSQLVSDAALFPFEIQVSRSELEKCSGLRLFREGSGEDVVELSKRSFQKFDRKAVP